MLVCSTSPWLLHKEPVSLIVQSNGVIRVVESRTNRLIVENNNLPPEIRLIAFATGEFAVVGLGDVPQIVHCNARELIGISALLLACTHEDSSVLRIMQKSHLTTTIADVIEDAFAGSVYFARNAAVGSEKLENPYYLESNRIQSLLDFFHKQAKDFHEEVLDTVLHQQNDDGLNAICLRLAQAGLYATESYLCHVWSGYMFASTAGNLDFKHLIAHPERELAEFGLSNVTANNVPLTDSTANAILRRGNLVVGGRHQLAASCLQTRSIAIVSHQENVCRIFTMPNETCPTELTLWFSFYVKPENSILDVALSCYKEHTAFEVELTRRRERCIVETSMSKGALVFVTPQGENKMGRLGRVLAKTNSNMYLIQLGSSPLSTDDSRDITKPLPRNTCCNIDVDSTNILPVYYPCSRVLLVTEKRELEHDYFYSTVILVTELGASVYERHWEAEAWRPRLVTMWEMPNLEHAWFYSPTSCLLATRTGEVYLWENVTELGQPPTEIWQAFPSKTGLTFSRSSNLFVLCDEHCLRVFSFENRTLMLEWESLHKSIVATHIEEDLHVRVLFADGTMEMIPLQSNKEQPEASFENILTAHSWKPIRFAGRSIANSREWFESTADGELKDLHAGEWEFAPTVTCESERYAVFGEVEIGLLPDTPSVVVMVGVENNMVEISKTTHFVLTCSTDKLIISLTASVAYVRLKGRTASRDEQALRLTYASEAFQNVLWTTVSTMEAPVAALVLLRANFDKSKLTRNMLIDFIQHQFVTATHNSHDYYAAVDFLESLPFELKSVLLVAALHSLKTWVFHSRQALDALLKACQICFVNVEQPERFVDMLLQAGHVLGKAQTWKTKVLSQIFACQFDPFANTLPGSAQAALVAANDAEKDADLCSGTKKKPAIRVHSFSNGSSTVFRKEAAEANSNNGGGSIEICFQDVLKANTTHGVVWDLSYHCKLTSIDLSIALLGEEDWNESSADRFACTVETFTKPPATWTGEKMAYTAHDALGLPFDIDMFAVSGSFSFDRDGVIGMKSTFPTIAPRAVAMLSGKHYYEVTVYNVREGVAQIGFCDSQHMVDDRGSTGCGDCIHSWAFDGNRLKKWNKSCITWGRRWADGDVVGCAIDMDEGKVYFSLNGSWKRPMGLAFSDIKIAGGVFPAVTGERGFKCKMNFGQTPFAHSPPTGAKPFKPVVDWIVANRQRQQQHVAQGTEAPTLWVRETFVGANATISSSTPPCVAKYLRITFTSFPVLGDHTEEVNHSRKRVAAKINVRLVGKPAPPTMLILTEEDTVRFRTVLSNARRDLDFALDQFTMYNLSLPSASRWTAEDTAQMIKCTQQRQDLSAAQQQLPHKYVLRIVNLLALIEFTQRDMACCTAECNLQDDAQKHDQWRVVSRFICNTLPLRGNNGLELLPLTTLAALFERFYVDQAAFNRESAGRMIQWLLCNSSDALPLFVHLAKAKIGTDEDLLQVILPVPIPAMRICEEVVPELVSSKGLVPLCCKLFALMSQEPQLPKMDTAQCVNQLLDLMVASKHDDDVRCELQCLKHLRQVSISPQTFLQDLYTDPRFIAVFQRISTRQGFGMEKIAALELLEGGAFLPHAAADSKDLSLELELALLPQEGLVAQDQVLRLATRVFAPMNTHQHVSVQVAKNWALMFRLLAQLPQQPLSDNNFAVFALTACLNVTDALLSAVFVQDLLLWLTKLGPTRNVLELLCSKSLSGPINESLCCKVLDLYVDCSSAATQIDYNGLVVGWIHNIANALQNNRGSHLDVLASALALCVHLISLHVELVDELMPMTFDAFIAWFCSIDDAGAQSVRRITATLFRLFCLAAHSTNMISSLGKALVTLPSDMLFLLAKRLVALQSKEAAQVMCNYLAYFLANTQQQQQRSLAVMGKEIALKFDFMQGSALPVTIAVAPSKTLLIKLCSPAMLSKVQLDFTEDGPVMVSVEAGLSDTVLVPCIAPQVCSKKTATFDVAPLTCKFIKLDIFASTSAAVEPAVDWFVYGDKVKRRTDAESTTLETGTVMSFNGELVSVKWLNGERNTHEKSTLTLSAPNSSAPVDNSTALTNLHLFGHDVIDLPTLPSLNQLADLLLMYCNKHTASVLFSSPKPSVDVLAQVKQHLVFPINTSTKRMLALQLVKSKNTEFTMEVMDYCLERFTHPQCLALGLNLALDGTEAANKYVAKARVGLDSFLYSELPPTLSLLSLIRGWALLVENAPEIAYVEDFSLAWLALDKAMAESALEFTLGQLVCTMARNSDGVLQHAKQLEVNLTQRKFAILATSCNDLLRDMLPAIDAYCQQAAVFPSTCLFDKLVLIARERTTLFSTWFRESGWFTHTLNALPTVLDNATLKRKMLHLVTLCCNQNARNQTLVAESLATAATCDVDLLALCTKFENYIQVCVWDIAHEIDLLANEKPSPDGDRGAELLSLSSSSSQHGVSWFRLNAASCGKTIELSNGGLVATQISYDKWGAVRADRELPLVGQSVWEIRLDQSPKGHVFVGVATDRSNLDGYLGCDRHSYGYIGNRGLWHNKHKETTYGKEFKTGDLIKVVADMNEGTISYVLNGENLGVAFTGLLGLKLYPAFSMYQKGDRLTVLYSTHVATTAVGATESLAPAGADSSALLQLHRRPLQDASLAAWRSDASAMERCYSHACGKVFWVASDQVLVSRALHSIGRGCVLDALRRATNGEEETNQLVASNASWDIEFTCQPENAITTATLSQFVQANQLDAVECRVNVVGL